MLSLRLFAVLFPILLSCCCNKELAKKEITARLDASDARGAVKAIEGGCLKDDQDYQSTKALLLFEIALEERPGPDRDLQIKQAEAVLERSAERSESGKRILKDYREGGLRFFQLFPWGHLLGPGPRPGQPRSM